MQMQPLLFIIASMFVPLLMQAQEDFQPQSSLGFTPQYLINQGLSIEWEKRLDTNNNWLKLSSQFYFDERSNQSMNYEELSGLGIEAHHKMYLLPDKIGSGPYLSYGLLYQYFELKYADNDWTSYTEDGLDYTEYKRSLHSQWIHKTGVNLLLGYQLIRFNRLFMDVYLGSGLRISFRKENDENTPQYNESSTDFGYSGTLVVGGVRFGVMF
ncbi:MAG: hypothetical protein ACLFNL_10805 [Bacteroidales bacterium]